MAPETKAQPPIHIKVVYDPVQNRIIVPKVEGVQFSIEKSLGFLFLVLKSANTVIGRVRIAQLPPEIAEKEELENVVVREDKKVRAEQPSDEESVVTPSHGYILAASGGVTYEVGVNVRYSFPKWYSLRFLRPVTIDTGKGFGWPEGLGGLNYVGTGRRFARSDWLFDDADRIISHEIKHDAPLFHGHNLAEYWNRLTDPVTFIARKPQRSHEPEYDERYVA